MIIAVCVDDKMGMLFNHRRQSHDKFLIDDLMNITEKVHINSFSQELFGEYAKQLFTRAFRGICRQNRN